MKCIDDEIPFEIPEGWEWSRLGMLFSHCTGKALNGINKKGKLYTYITTSNLYWDRFEMSTLKEMYFTDEELDKCTAIKGDLLVCEGGDIGRSAIWNYDYDIRIQNHIHKLRAYLPLCTRFFYYVMFLYKGIGNIGGKGIGIQGLSSGALHNIILPLPPISEQERITAQIETIMPFATKYEKSQDELNRLNDDIYTRLRKSILQEAIQGKLVPQDPNDEPASVLLERIREEKLRLLKEGKLKKKDITDSVIFKGEDNKYYERLGKSIIEIDEHIPFNIPESWEWTTLDFVSYSVGSRANQVQSKEILKEGYYPVVSQGLSLVDGYVNDGSKIIKDLPVILFGDHTRNVKYIDFPFVIGADGTKLHKAIGIYPQYLFLWMLYAANTLRDRGYARHYSLLRKTYIPLPPYKEQIRIVKKYDTALASIMSR